MDKPYTLEDVRREYRRLDARCGVDTSAIALKISRRAVSQYGCCKCMHGRPVEIRLSDFIMHDEALFWQTIRHEYAHALVQLRRPGEHHGHDALWKNACLEVGCAPERCSAAPSAEAEARRRSRTRYILRCQHCGHTWHYLRAGKTVKLVLSGKGRTLTCPYCRSRGDFTCTQKD